MRKVDLHDSYIVENDIVVEVQKKSSNINLLLAYSLKLARKKAGLTQNALSEKTGISQADISRIERGLGNPSLDTLNRLAEGLGAELYIDFHLKIAEGYQAMLEGRVSRYEDVKERIRKKREEQDYSDLIEKE